MECFLYRLQAAAVVVQCMQALPLVLDQTAASRTSLSLEASSIPEPSLAGGFTWGKGNMLESNL